MISLHAVCKCYMYCTYDPRKRRPLGCIETSEANPRKNRRLHIYLHFHSIFPGFRKSQVSLQYRVSLYYDQAMKIIQRDARFFSLTFRMASESSVDGSDSGLAALCQDESPCMSQRLDSARQQRQFTG